MWSALPNGIETENESVDALKYGGWRISSGKYVAAQSRIRAAARLRRSADGPRVDRLIKNRYAAAADPGSFRRLTRENERPAFGLPVSTCAKARVSAA